ncbi:MAG: PHB depolymerase family esterase, partial [Chloroflexota bacterium]
MPLLHQLYFQGRWERDYLLYLPVNYTREQPIPLLLVLHGGSGTAHSMIKLTQGIFNTLADEHNFMVVYPNGFGRQWNDGRFQVRGGRNIDDVGFIRELIDSLASAYAVDTQHVFVTGMSNGGHMAYRLACDLSDKIAGIASVAALMPDNLEQACTPHRPMPVLIIAGTEDTLVPYRGGTVGGQLLRRGTVASADVTLRFWAKINGCTGEPEVTDLEDRDPRDGTHIRETLYSSCDAPTVMYTIVGGGHTWPGGLQYLDERIIGKTSR